MLEFFDALDPLVVFLIFWFGYEATGSILYARDLRKVSARVERLENHLIHLFDTEDTPRK